MIDKKARQGFEEEAEDCHALTEALQVSWGAFLGIEDAEVNDVREDREQQANQELEIKRHKDVDWKFDSPTRTKQPKPMEVSLRA